MLSTAGTVVSRVQACRKVPSYSHDGFIESPDRVLSDSRCLAMLKGKREDVPELEPVWVLVRELL